MIDLDKTKDSTSDIYSERQLIVSDDMMADIMSIAKWIKICTVIEAIFFSVLVISSLLYMFINISFGIMLLIYAGIFFIPLKKSFAFVEQARDAVRYKNNEDLAKMFANWKFLAKFAGISLLVIISLYLLVILLNIFFRWYFHEQY